VTKFPSSLNFNKLFGQKSKLSELFEQKANLNEQKNRHGRNVDPEPAARQTLKLIDQIEL